MRWYLRLWLLSVLMIVGVFSSNGFAELQINVTQGKIQPLPIAVTSFQGANAQEAQIGANIAQVVAADLERSGLFRLIDPKAYIQDLASLRRHPRFADWRVLNTQALVAGSVSVSSSGMLTVEFRLWDVFNETQIEGLEKQTPASNWRRVAHQLADAIYKRITGEEGYFDTRVVYVSETGPLTRRVRRLAIMDQDGENHKFLTSGKDMVLTPRFSPRAQELAFLAYINKRPRVYLLKIATGQVVRLGEFPGMTLSPRFSPDGKRVLVSFAYQGKTILCSVDLLTRTVTNLTSPVSIDTSPSFSPDGRQIVFTSDRGGSPQLYVMRMDGLEAKRISFGPGSYTAPCWSPRGDWIAFIRRSPGRKEFFLGVMRPDGSGERYLTKGFFMDMPSWSPNGRVLIFQRQAPASRDGRGGASKIFTIDITGFYEREVVTPHDASDPSWSPLSED